MRSFSTCRSRFLLASALSIGSALLATARPAHAIDPERELSQYVRDRWGTERGYPGGPVYAITQSADGYLWIGADKGLVRFDGLTFSLFEPSGVTEGAGPTVLGVASAPDGSLWARLRGPALVRYQDGAFENMFSDVGLPESVVTAMFRGSGDVFLLSTLGQGTVSYNAGAYHRVAGPGLIPTSSFVISIARTDDGEIWLGTRDAGLLRVQGQRVTRIMAGLPDLKINCLLPTADGLWIGTDKGVARWNGAAVERSGVPAELNSVTVLSMLRDRDANVWIAGGSHGLLRVTSQGTVAADQRDTRLSGAVSTVFEDREGNLWVGTSKGIERLREGVFTTHSAVQGLPDDSPGPVYVDEAGRTWFGPAEGGLFSMRDGRVERVTLPGPPGDVVYSITGYGNDIWIGRQRGGMTRITTDHDRLALQQLTQDDGLAQNSVYAVHRARDGAIWAGTLSGGVSRFKDGVFTTYSRATGLLSNTVSSIVETVDGTMWFATASGISTLSRGGWRHYTERDGLPSGDVHVLLDDTEGNVWAGTAGGLAVFTAGVLSTSRIDHPLLRAPILGIAADRNGWLWLASADRLMRVHRQSLLDDVLGPIAIREFGVADGLLSLDGVKRHRSVTTDARGRVWISMGRGLSMADPARIDGGAMPALVHVGELAVDGTPLPRRAPLLVPPGGRRVSLSYAGLSLGVPERVRFRYRLDGFDHDWSAPVVDRQAVYTNLSPGAYTFRLIASNGDGVWNGTESSLRFEVEPVYWQRAWFQAAVVIILTAMGWAVYRIRVFQVARQLNQRFDARLAERTRIAQELHDTLLQGFLSASMQLHVTAERLPADSPAKSSLTHVLELMSRVIEEGRNAVRGLRSTSSAPHELGQAFSSIHHEFTASDRIDYRVVIEGRARALKPIIRDEVYRIGREALVNAFRHAGAAHIEIEIEYATSALRVFVRDDGRGIDPHVALRGADGHWGIAGMRERARSIGAHLTVRSRADAGTEVELAVPGDVAFEVPPRSLRSWTRRQLARIRRRQKELAP